jgi:hypothetical protein
LRGVDEEEEEKGRATGSPNSLFRLFRFLKFGEVL